MRKVTSVFVYWTFTVEKEGLFNVINTTYLFNGNDLKGKSKWSDVKWINLALEEYSSLKSTSKSFDKDNVQDVRVWTEYA